jgi:hypothetical protein
MREKISTMEQPTASEIIERRKWSSPKWRNGTPKRRGTWDFSATALGPLSTALQGGCVALNATTHGYRVSSIQTRNFGVILKE